MLVSVLSYNPAPRQLRGRVGLFTCECGCMQEFFAEIKTRHPRYENRTHRARAYRARARARSIAWKASGGWQTGTDESFNTYYYDALRDEMAKNRGK
jgi:hypothetical protein